MEKPQISDKVAVIKLEPYQYLVDSERARASVGAQVLREMVGEINAHRFHSNGTKKIIHLQLELG